MFNTVSIFVGVQAPDDNKSRCSEVRPRGQPMLGPAAAGVADGGATGPMLIVWTRCTLALGSWSYACPLQTLV